LVTSLSIPVEQKSVRCRVAARTLVRAPADVIAQWRRQPIEFAGEKLSASFLKHAEDQTVAGVHALLQACAQQGWHERTFADWGAIAAPNLFGRNHNARAIEQYRNEGAWGISPHLIPQQSLHALSGSISQVLKLHGPNFGVSGGPNAGPDAMLIAATMLADGALPGLWVILTGHETEWLPQDAAPPCLAVAIALTSDFSPSPLGEEPGPQSLSRAERVAERTPHLVVGRGIESELAILPEFHVALLAEDWQAGSKWRLSDTQWLELESSEAHS
jgi:hypothetical protein